MRIRLVAILLAMILLFNGCQYNMGSAIAQDGYRACYLAGVDVEGKPHAEWAALGVIQVRMGDCDGEQVNFSGTVYSQLWRQQAVGGSIIRELCATAYEELAPPFVTPQLHALAMIGPDDDDCTVDRGAYRAEVIICFWTFGDRYCSNVLVSPWELP